MVPESTMNTAASALVLSALYSPVLANGVDHYLIGLNRFSIRDSPIQKPMAAATPPDYHGPSFVEMPVFKYQYVQREMKKVVAKYEAAPEVFQGIGLNPQLNIPFVNNFPAFDDPSTVTTNNSDANQRVSHVQKPYSKQSLRDFMSGPIDIMYFGTLDIGTPPQTLPFDIDTGSADLWVTSGCSGCFSDEYDPSASSTYQDQGEDFSIAYGTGEVSGRLGMDTVSLAGLKYTNQTFGVANVESHDFDGLPISGIMGTAFGSISTSGSPTVFENLMATGQVLAPFFSVHMARASRTGSEVCWGCFDMSKAKGAMTWVPVESQTYWTVGLRGVSVNDKLIQTDIYAAIDGYIVDLRPECVCRESLQPDPWSEAVRTVRTRHLHIPLLHRSRNFAELWRNELCYKYTRFQFGQDEFEFYRLCRRHFGARRLFPRRPCDRRGRISEVLVHGI